jgi:hypothetical protein
MQDDAVGARARADWKLDLIITMLGERGPDCLAALEVTDLDTLRAELRASHLTEEALIAYGEQRWEEGRATGDSAGYVRGYGEGREAGIDAGAALASTGVIPLPQRWHGLQAV